MSQTLKVIGQAVILWSIGMQFFIANDHKAEDAKIATHQSRVWDAEHKMLLGQQTLSILKRGPFKDSGVKASAERKLARRTEKEIAARASLIRQSIKSAEARIEIGVREICSAIIFVLGSLILLFGEALLIPFRAKDKS